MTSLGNIFTMEKAPFKIIFGRKIVICEPISKMFAALFKTFGMLRFRCILGQFLANFDMFFTPYHSKIETCIRLAPSLLIRYK